jgi:hypothetical protein
LALLLDFLRALGCHGGGGGEIFFMMHGDGEVGCGIWQDFILDCGIKKHQKDRLPKNYFSYISKV